MYIQNQLFCVIMLNQCDISANGSRSKCRIQSVNFIFSSSPYYYDIRRTIGTMSLTLNLRYTLFSNPVTCTHRVPYLSNFTNQPFQLYTANMASFVILRHPVTILVQTSITQTIWLVILQTHTEKVFTNITLI